MADIIPFAPRPTRAGARPSEQAERGTILFFTGIRYERRDDSGPTTARRQPGAPSAPTSGRTRRPV